MARKQVYMYFHTDNPESNFGATTRAIVCSTFNKAYAELTRDYLYFLRKGYLVGDAWYNDYDINKATCAVVPLIAPDGQRLDLMIVPSYIY